MLVLLLEYSGRNFLRHCAESWIGERRYGHGRGLLWYTPAAETEENHARLRSEQPVSRPGFEPGTLRTHLQYCQINSDVWQQRLDVSSLTLQQQRAFNTIAQLPYNMETAVMSDVARCSLVAMYRLFCQTTRRHIPEDSSLSCHRLKNLKSHIFIILQMKFGCHRS